MSHWVFDMYPPRIVVEYTGTLSCLTICAVPGMIGWLLPEIEDFPSGKRMTFPPCLIICITSSIGWMSLMKFRFGMTLSRSKTKCM